MENNLIKQLCSSPFGFMCDESNDTNDKKLIKLVRLYDETTKVATHFLDMPICNRGARENSFSTIDNSLRSRNIPWSNMFSIVTTPQL